MKEENLVRAKKFIAALLIAVLSISIFPKGVKAIDNTETWESKYTDDTRKVWKINFSSPLSGSVDSNNIRDYIYLQDYNNNKINVSITIASDRKYVEVSYPHYGYEKNKNYYLVIKSGLQSKDGKKTTKTIKIPFVVNDFIYFKDKNLENEIRKNISKPKGGILKEDVVNVQALYLSNRNIESLEGLNYFTNLKTLSINDNKVKDITPLKNLSNLEKLYAENNIIEDITNLKGLYKLKELNLRGNRIQNIDALSSLSSYYLISLDLGNNKVSKVSSLTYLTGLTSLKLDNNYIEDITSIKNLTNLKTLYLDKNDITNYSPVLNYYDKLLYKDFSLDYPISITDANLQKILREEINKPKGDLYYRDFANMKELDLSNASIYSLTGIKNLTSLEKLNLSGIKATNFSELQYLKNLKELNINDTSSHSKSFLSSLKDLEILNASDANVYGSDLYYLRNLVDLTELDLSDNNIYSDDLEELIDLNKLLKLSLKGNPHLDSIDELKNHMKNLVYLNIADTNITNGENLLSTINTFPKLESLDTTNLKLDKEVSLNQRINFLDSNFEGAIREVIQKYSGDIYTKDIRNIEKLELQNKNISNISGIENFAALKYLDLSNNNIVNVKPLNSLINLETLILHDNKVNTEANSFSNLDKLTYLDLSNNNITSISCLEVLTGLKKLDLSNNSIERINELRGLKSLEYLSLYNNKIGYNDTVDGKPREPANLGYLGYMFNLKELFLGENTLVRDYSYILSYYERLQNKDFTIDLDKAVFKLPDDSDGTLIKDAVKAKGCSVDPQGYIL
ncbi:hypothetical protein GOM49_12705 [Clostridium bovifaecis]|uniref:Leucine-rich repeat protein n=1 Tax=Clostridium bovifaecis TaxID=2184719 RepID=A0A6I6F018_9CLOT|nr:hypothetical protein GOM49_12705 [Clostridium bovifaecis]